MKLYQLAFTSLLIGGLVACGGNQETETDNSAEDLLDLLEEDNTDWTTQSDGEFCEIDIPNSMDVMAELNPLASIKYGSVENTGSRVLENYVIVIPETHEEIAAYEFDFEFNLESYSEVCVEGMLDGLKDYEILTGEPKVTEINGLNAIVTELQGGIAVGEDGTVIDIFYMMGVFKGEKAYYQVLSWTLEDQKSMYWKDMEKMIQSFKEI